MRILGYDFNVVEILIGLNVITFFASLIYFDYFITNYSLVPGFVAQHPWTIVTSMFLHGGLDHIIFNMFSLYFFGLYLGSIIGEKELLKVYFAGGILGGLFFVLNAFMGTPYPLSLLLPAPSLMTAAVGASGAIFALGAALAVLRPQMRVFIFPIPFPMPLYLAVFVFMVVLSFLPGIAWQGHLGGLAAGALFGYWYKRKQPYSGHMYGTYDRQY